MPTDAITITQDDLMHRLDEAAGQPVVIEHNGVRYRIEPEDPFAFYDPEKMREAIDAGFGAWKDAGIIQSPAETPTMPVEIPDLTSADRAAMRHLAAATKPRTKSLAWGPETRYGREDDFNTGYNEGIDEYETALLKQLNDEPESKPE